MLVFVVRQRSYVYYVHMFVGKVLCGATAFIITLNPVYALFGLGLGALVDEWIGRVLLSSHRASLWQQDVSLLVVMLVAQFARANGVVAKEEIQVFRRSIAMPKSDELLVGHYFNVARNESIRFEQTVEELFGALREQPAILVWLIELLCEVALANKYLAPEHEAHIKKAAHAWRVPSYVYEEMLFGAPTAKQQNKKNAHSEHTRAENVGGENPYDVLGVERGASMAEVKKAYKQLVKDHHPDKMRGQDKSDQQIKAAETNLARINAAYNAIKE